MIDLQNPNAHQDSINAFLELQEKAMRKRLEYLTTEIMPESPLKDMKMAKIEIERTQLESEFNTLVSEMIGAFGMEILNDLV